MTFRSSLADWCDVPTGSMRPTILEGDRILVNKLAYDLRVPFVGWRVASWADPARGEVVIFPSPKDGTRLVKRIVGLPGDSVELRHNVLYINGLKSDYSLIDPGTLAQVPASEQTGRNFSTERLPGGAAHALTTIPSVPSIKSFGPVTVPPGHYLALGDNRDQSADSRYFGFVPRASIIGRSSRIAISLDYAHGYLPRWSRTGRSLD
ncbi:MAG: signal peptidase I, partial [Phycisphaerae bacterium]|nr:signal peptidase I [Phycisphaerae bacterium]